MGNTEGEELLEVGREVAGVWLPVATTLEVFARGLAEEKPSSRPSLMDHRQHQRLSVIPRLHKLVFIRSNHKEIGSKYCLSAHILRLRLYKQVEKPLCSLRKHRLH